MAAMRRHERCIWRAVRLSRPEATLSVFAVALAMVAVPAQADRNLSIYPAAQCAAFWAGYSDYAQLSTHVDEDPQDIERANAFRAVALRLGTASPDEIDRYIDEQRPLMVSLLDAVIYNRSRASRDVFERLTETCKSFGAEHDETRSLI